MSKDWIPTSQAGFYETVNITVSYIIAHKTELGFAETQPDGKYFKDVVIPATADYSSALGDWQVPENRTPAISNTLKLKREVLEPIYRRLAAILKGSPLVTDDDLFKMGIPPRRTGSGTPAPKADEAPGYTTEILSDHRVRLHVHDAKSVNKRGKPAGQHGFEVRWAIFPEIRDVHVKELNRSSFDTRSPFTFELEDTDSTKILYFTLRWENTRGEKGPSSPIDHVVIP